MQPRDAIRNLALPPLQWVLMMLSLLLVAGTAALPSMSIPAETPSTPIPGVLYVDTAQARGPTAPYPRIGSGS